MPNNPAVVDTMAVNLAKGSKPRGRPKKTLDASDPAIEKKARKRRAEETNKIEKSSLNLAESTKDTTEVKPKKQKRKKAAASPPSPSCPHCFKFLLNPEKMRSHVAGCSKRTSQEHHIKLTIRLSSDKEKVEITESN